MPNFENIGGRKSLASIVENNQLIDLYKKNYIKFDYSEQKISIITYYKSDLHPAPKAFFSLCNLVFVKIYLVINILVSIFLELNPNIICCFHFISFRSYCYTFFILNLMNSTILNLLLQ